ncbi:hypothetical protein FJY63_02475 [Candidatus Sumerlaeota bacterium]|nr:hypothetical protein [Candidatus Sumerlaeota bacterium]
MMSWRKMFAVTAMISAAALVMTASAAERPAGAKRARGGAGEKAGAGAAGERRGPSGRAMMVVANFVVKEAGLEGEKAKEFLKAYRAESMEAAKRVAEAMKGDDQAARFKVRSANREALQKLLEANLSAEQAKKLGAIDLSGLESSVGALLTAKIEDAKLDQALAVLVKYHREIGKLYALPREQQREAFGKMKEMRADVAKELAPIVGEEVAKKWAETPRFGMGGRPPKQP